MCNVFIQSFDQSSWVLLERKKEQGVSTLNVGWLNVDLIYFGISCFFQYLLDQIKKVSLIQRINGSLFEV